MAPDQPLLTGGTSERGTSCLIRLPTCHRAFCARPRRRDSSACPAGRSRSTELGMEPKYRNIGGRVVYALDDLKAWAELGAKTSTSDPGVGTVHPAKRVVAPHVNGQAHRR